MKGEKILVEDLGTGEKEELTEKEYYDKYAYDSKPVDKMAWDKKGEVIDKPKHKDRLSGFTVNAYFQNVRTFHNLQPFFYDKTGLFWFWNPDLYKYEIVDEVDLMNELEFRLTFNGETIQNSIKGQYLEAFKRIGRKNHPKEAPSKWIQFKDKAYSLNSGKIYEVTPHYFFTNPIPWELGESTETPKIDKLFNDWVGKDYVKTLYQIIAYCCYRDYPIHLIFCLVGCGRNGKSKFLGLVEKFIDNRNICSTELDTLLSNRFESFKLFTKLVCSMGETNFGTMTKTSLLKKLCGQDLIGFEKKNKDPFDSHNYAKILISSNSLPSSTDTSDGFYRRWLIIDFPNEFSCDNGDILKTIPDVEYNNLAKKCIELLPELLKNNKFHNQGSIEERKEKYIVNSNPWHVFKDYFCEEREDGVVKYAQLYTEYKQFLIQNKKRSVTKKEFRTALEDDGFFIERTTKKIDDELISSNFVIGLEIKKNVKNVKTLMSPFSSSRKGGQLEDTTFLHFLHKKEPEIEQIDIISQKNCQNVLKWEKGLITFHKCNVDGCNEFETNIDSNGLHFCIKHWDLMAN